MHEIGQFDSLSFSLAGLVMCKMFFLLIKFCYRDVPHPADSEKSQQYFLQVYSTRMDNEVKVDQGPVQNHTMLHCMAGFSDRIYKVN